MRKRCTCGIKSSNRPGRDQSCFCGTGIDASPTRPITAQLVSLLSGRDPSRDRIDHELGGQPAGDHHRAPGQKRRPVGRAAPEHEPVPARRPFIGEQFFAHHRMDAVGADQNVAARGVAMDAAAIEEIGGDAAIVLSERAEPAIQMNARFAEPGARRLVDDVLQPAAMDRELRNVVAGIEAARLAPDLLAETIGVDELVGADRDRVEPVEQAEVGKLLDRMGSVLMPTPSSRIASDCSKISQSIPRACSISPVTRPPTPPPAMITFMTLPLTRSSQFAASLPQVAENATICRRHGYDGVPAAAAWSICLRMIFSEKPGSSPDQVRGLFRDHALRARLSILPTPVRGSASRNAMCFGHLYLTRFCLQ